MQCAWQAANTVRRSNKKKKKSNRNNHCRWHALWSVRNSLSLYVRLRHTVAQLRRGVRKDARPGRIMVVETCEDLSARRVRVGLVYGNVTAVRWVVRPMLDERLQHCAYNSSSSTGGLFRTTRRNRNRVATLLPTCRPMVKNAFTSAIAIVVGGTNSVLYSKTFDGGVVATAFRRNLKQ